jgi:hypothetical protein
MCVHAMLCQLRTAVKVTRTVVGRQAATLPVSRVQSRQMSAHHGPPDPWPKNDVERKSGNTQADTHGNIGRTVLQTQAEQRRPTVDQQSGCKILSALVEIASISVRRFDRPAATSFTLR